MKIEINKPKYYILRCAVSGSKSKADKILEALEYIERMTNNLISAGYAIAGPLNQTFCSDGRQVDNDMGGYRGGFLGSHVEVEDTVVMWREFILSPGADAVWGFQVPSTMALMQSWKLEK